MNLYKTDPFFAVNIPQVKFLRPAYVFQHCWPATAIPLLSFHIPLPQDLLIYFLINTLPSISIPATLKEGWHSI